MNKIKTCKQCDLYQKAGVNVPYIGSQAKYVIIGESASNGKQLLDRNKSDFWELLTNYGLRKIDFGVIHSINCYSKRPSEYHRDCCRPWIKKFVEEIKPKLIILCGNFAMHTFTDKWGIKKYENKIQKVIFNKQYYNVMYWQHPNIMIYNDKPIKKSLDILKDYL